MSALQSFLKHFLKHQNDLRAFIGSMVVDRSCREDVFQEVALTLWQQYDHFDAGRSFGAWARGIAANKILQAKRNDRRFPMPFSPEVVQKILDAFEARADPPASRYENGLNHCLNELTKRSREILAMHYEKRLSGDEMARVTGRTVAAIYKQLSRIRQQLARCIERYVHHANV